MASFSYSIHAPLRSSLLVLSIVLALGGCKANGGDEAKNADSSQTTGKGDKKSADGKDKANEQPPIPVEAIPAQRRAISANYTSSTTLEPRAEAQVVAKTSGVALKVLVEEGQSVKAGQALVKLDADRSTLALSQIEAQLRKLESNYNRAQKLAEQQLISLSESDQLRYDLANVRAQYNLARLELSYTTVTAPISGVIASRSIKEGNLVQINTPIFRIVDDSKLEATLNIPEKEISTLKAGLPATIHLDALPGQAFTGVVNRISPVVDAGSGTFRVVSTFDGKGDLQPGMFGRLRIDYDQRDNALVIPRIALLDNENDPAVFVVRGDKATRTTIQVGYTDGEWVEVRSGINEGEKVVTAGKSALREGSVVQMLSPAPTTKPATTPEKPAAATASATSESGKK